MRLNRIKENDEHSDYETEKNIFPSIICPRTESAMDQMMKENEKKN